MQNITIEKTKKRIAKTMHCFVKPCLPVFHRVMKNKAKAWKGRPLGEPLWDRSSFYYGYFSATPTPMPKKMWKLARIFKRRNGQRDFFSVFVRSKAKKFLKYM